MTCYIAVWKIIAIHNIIVWMCYITCYIWFKPGDLPPPPLRLSADLQQNESKACFVYLILISQAKHLNTLGVSSSSVAAPFNGSSWLSLPAAAPVRQARGRPLVHRGGTCTCAFFVQRVRLLCQSSSSAKLSMVLTDIVFFELLLSFFLPATWGKSCK